MTLDGQIIGQAERATRALLELRLRHVDLAFEQWVALNQLHADPRSRDVAVARLAGGLKIPDLDARAAIDGAIARGLVQADGDRLSLTAAGVAQFTVVRDEVVALTDRLYGDLPPEELAVTGRVLTLVTERANAELAAATT